MINSVQYTLTEATSGKTTEVCGTPPPRHSSQWLNGQVQLYLFLSSVRRGLRRCLRVLRRCYVYIEKFTLRTKIFCLEGWDPRFSFVSCGNKKEGHGEAFLAPRTPFWLHCSPFPQNAFSDRDGHREKHASHLVTERIFMPVQTPHKPSA